MTVRPHDLLSRSALLVLALLPLRSPAHATEQAERIVVNMRPTADVVHSIVLLRDIAEVRVESASLKEQIGTLDILALEKEGAADVVSAKQVRVRLLLDGFSSKQIVMTGARDTAVTWKGAAVRQAEFAATRSVDDVLRDLAVTQLSEAWLVPPEDVDVQFLVQDPLGEGIPQGTTPELEMPTRLEPGRLAARIRWMRGGRLERIEQLTMEVRLRQDVLLASATISRGEVLAPADFIEERRLLSTRVQSLVAEEVVGRAARRSLSQGDVILARDITTSSPDGPAVKPRDTVKVTVRKGALTVVLQAAEALQSGRIGDVIRVRNTQSNQILTGRLVSPQEVEIVLN